MRLCVDSSDAYSMFTEEGPNERRDEPWRKIENEREGEIRIEK